MNPTPLDRVRQSPALIRVVPYAIFVALIYLQGPLGPTSPFWVYGLRTLGGLGLILWMRPLVAEMRWSFSWEAVGVGVLVFVLWVGLDPFYPGLGGSGGWNPNTVFGESSVLAIVFLVVRLAGSTLVVPPLEEVFFRSFLYRTLQRQDFLAVSLRVFQWKPFVITAVVFGLIHNEWLAGILCGAAYQALVLRRGRLGEAMTAHATTNFLLGVYVISRGAWQFW